MVMTRQNWILVFYVLMGFVVSHAFAENVDEGSAERDLGVVDSSVNELQVRFNWKNPTNMAVEIREIASSCSCSSVTPSKTRIGPGESIDLRLVTDVSDKWGRTTGRFIVSFHDAATVPKVFRYSFVRNRLATVDPDPVEIGDVVRGVTVRRKAKVSCVRSGGADIEFTIRDKGLVPGLAIELEPLRKWKMRVEGDDSFSYCQLVNIAYDTASVELGPFDFSIPVNVSENGVASVVEIKCVGAVVSELKCEPRSLLRVVNEASYSEILQIRGLGSDVMSGEIVATTTNEAISASIVQTKSLKSTAPAVEVRIQFANSNIVEGDLILEAQIRGKPEKISVPIVAMRAGKGNQNRSSSKRPLSD